MIRDILSRLQENQKLYAIVPGEREYESVEQTLLAQYYRRLWETHSAELTITRQEGAIPLRGVKGGAGRSPKS